MKFSSIKQPDAKAADSTRASQGYIPLDPALTRPQLCPSQTPIRQQLVDMQCYMVSTKRPVSHPHPHRHPKVILYSSVTTVVFCDV